MLRKRPKACCLLIMALFLLSSCAAPVHKGMIRDLEILPQNSVHYIPDLSREFFSSRKQQELYSNLEDAYFSPWSGSVPRHKKDEVFWAFASLKGRTLYGENLLPLSGEWLDEMREKSDISGYPSRHEPAVTVDNAHMRVLPSSRPVFLDPDRPGQGFPFDRLQNTLVPAGTPVLITHATREGDWAMVETGYAAGWMQWSSLALADEDFMRRYRSGSLAGVVRDREPVSTEEGRFVFTGRIGMLLPAEPGQDMEEQPDFLVPVRDFQGRALLVPGRASSGAVKRIPLRPTGDNFADILNSMLGEPYGWGGLYLNRDCSALLQDIFRMFGISLPRNSAQQMRFQDPISLEGLDRREKLDLILEQGRPLVTILYMPGHVMLYLGADPGTGLPVVYHSMWGLRTARFWHGQPGRFIIGRTVITSLEPGKEMTSLARPEGLLINRLSRMTVLVQDDS